MRWPMASRLNTVPITCRHYSCTHWMIRQCLPELTHITKNCSWPRYAARGSPDRDPVLWVLSDCRIAEGLRWIAEDHIWQTDQVNLMFACLMGTWASGDKKTVPGTCICSMMALGSCHGRLLFAGTGYLSRARERYSQQLSHAQMGTFSLPAPSAPSCYDLQRSPFKHAHSTARQPQLRRFTDLCSRSPRSGDACAKVVRCSMGQVQSTLQFSCCSNPCSQRSFLLNSHLKASERSVLPVLQGHGNPPYQCRQDGALPARAPAQDFQYQCDAEEVDRAAHAAAEQVRGHTPPGPARAQSGCQQYQPCMMLLALHLHCPPCGNIPSHLAQLPTCCGRPVHCTAC